MKLAAMSVPFPGAKRPLEEGAKLGLWSFTLLQDGMRSLPAADTYLLAAWHPSYEQLLAMGDRRGILWTSSAGEMDFLPVERRYLWEIRQDPRIDFIWFGDEGLAEAYPEKGFYAPYPLVFEAKQKEEIKKEDICTLFCPTKPSKNIHNQLVAIKIVQKERKLKLFTNIEGYDDILAELDHVRMGWLPEKPYRNLIARAKVNLAVSWCETFAYNIAESFSMGTPCLISPTISWVESTELSTIIKINNPKDVLEIEGRLAAILDMNERDYSSLIQACRDHLKVVSCRQNMEVRRILIERGIL
jgi:glycosyltransferase involved in cell wall biosynthesis